MNSEETKVIFRWHDGECLALFPELPGTNDPKTCACYAMQGEHASAECVPFGRPATPKEFAPVKAALESRGYRLRIVSRFTLFDQNTRRRLINAGRKGVAA